LAELIRGNGRIRPFGPIDRHYENLRAGMRDPFAEIGIAA
jgi:hypothetical protein